MESAPVGLDPDEPHTPAWFSFLGLGLFLLAGLFFLVQSSDDEDPGAGQGAAAEDAVEGTPEEPEEQPAPTE